MVVLLSLFAAGVGAHALSTLNFSDRLFEQLRATYVARAGAQHARLALERDATPSVDGPGEWSLAQGALRERAVGGGVFTIQGGLSDEEQRLNLNAAPPEALQALVQQVGGLSAGEASEVAAAIQDWRDEDSEETPLGAEDYYYGSLSQPYACKDGPFENVEELLLLRGMSPPLYQRVEPFLTVHGSGRLNLNTASREVLSALGLSQAGLDGMAAFREAGHRLVSMADLESELKDYLPIKDMARLMTLAQQQVFTVRSTAFRASIEARTDHPASLMRVLCILERDGQVLLWSES